MDTIEDPRTGAAALDALGGRVERAAHESDGWADAPDLLRSLEHALLALSASWHGVACLAAPTIARLHDRDRRAGEPPIETVLSREQEVRLISALHDVSTDLTGAARSCRNARSIVEPLIDRRLRSRRQDEPRSNGADASG